MEQKQKSHGNSNCCDDFNIETKPITIPDIAPRHTPHETPEDCINEVKLRLELAEFNFKDAKARFYAAKPLSPEEQDAIEQMDKFKKEINNINRILNLPRTMEKQGGNICICGDASCLIGPFVPTNEYYNSN